VGILAGGDLPPGKYNRLPLDAVTRVTLLRRRQREHFASRGLAGESWGAGDGVPCWVKGKALMGRRSEPPGQSPLLRNAASNFEVPS